MLSTYLPELVLSESGICECVSPDGNVTPTPGGGGIGGVGTCQTLAAHFQTAISQNITIIPQTQQLLKDLWKMSPLMLG